MKFQQVLAFELSVITVFLSLTVTDAQLVRSYGQTCFFDVQCNDHRMVCEAQTNGSLVKRCLCDRLHVWSKEQKECVMSINITAMLATLEVSQFSEKVEKRNEEIFSGVVVAGITVIILGTLITFICIFYGCCLYECVDKIGRLEEGEAKEQRKSCQSSKSYVPSTIMRSGFR